MKTVIAITCFSLASALTAAFSLPALADTGLPAVTQAERSGGAGRLYLNGGAGTEERAAMQARAAEFPQQIVFSGEDGEYAVARQLTIVPRGEPSTTVVSIADAGPIVMLRLPAGTYEAAAVFDGRTEQRALVVSGAPQTVTWRVSGAGR